MGYVQNLPSQIFEPLTGLGLGVRMKLKKV